MTSWTGSPFGAWNTTTAARQETPRLAQATPRSRLDTADLFFDQFGIESHVVSLFATYGITDDWDVNILLPIIHTSLEVDARAVLNNESGTGTHIFERSVRMGCV